MKAASLDRDCLPEPPTPTSKALPLGLSKIRFILKTEKNTKWNLISVIYCGILCHIRGRSPQMTREAIAES